MQRQAKDILNLTRPGKILIPIVIGLGVASFMLFRNFDKNAFSNIYWTWSTTFWILVSLLMVVVRDWAYMVRIRILTEKQLNWKKAFDVIMLWEFCSAIAPAILGGGFAFAIFILHKEKVPMGKSISVVMFTSFLDGMFFALIAPIVYFTCGFEALFQNINSASLQKLSDGLGLYYLFWIVYFIILAYKLFVAYALFINARAVKAWLVRIFRWRPIQRWRYRAMITGTEMEIAARKLKKKNIWYWLKSFAATCISWSARFIIINSLLMAFSSIPFDHYLLYSRQVIMGILNVVSPTPGGSGTAEIMFSEFLGEFIGNNSLTSTLALLWRLISYYPYLFIGAILIPRWIKRVYKKEELKEEGILI